MLQDALARSVRISRELASLGVVVDAIDDAARTFYERWGFVRFQEDSYRLVLPMGSIEKLVEQTDNR